MLLALLICTQDVELDALGHPDPEERVLAARTLRRPDALPLLLRGVRHADPEVRARAGDVLRSLPPLAWAPLRDDPRASRFLPFRSPAPPDAVERSSEFLEDVLPGPVPLANLLESAPAWRQAVLLVGDLRTADLKRTLATAPLTSLVTGFEKPDDVVFALSEGVIWAGYRRDLETPPALAPWLLGRLEDPACLAFLEQMLPPELRERLLDDPSPAATDLMLVSCALRRGQELDPRFPARLAERLATLDRKFAAPLSMVLLTRGAELLPVLDAGARAPARWIRYLSAATAVQGIDPAAFVPLLRDPAAEIRRQAVTAVLRWVPRDAWDRVALLEAVESQSLLEREMLLTSLREARCPRLQATAVDLHLRTPEASLAVLEDCADPALLDAAIAAFRKDPRLARSTSLLRRMTETGEEAWPRERLKALLDDPSREIGQRAAYALAGLGAAEVLPLFEARLSTHDDRALYGIRRLAAMAGPDSCVTTNLRNLLRARAEAAGDSPIGRRLLDLAEEDVILEWAPHRMGRRRNLVARGCGSASRPSGGWDSLSIGLHVPDWKD